MSESAVSLLSGKSIGIFKGFAAEHGSEFAAELVVPFHGNVVNRPQLGHFILVELKGGSGREEALLGRITRMTSAGLLASPEGEDYLAKMRARDDEAPHDLMKRKLKYRVRVKLLGVLRGAPFKFMPSQRRLPPLGAPVIWPSNEVQAQICKLGGGKTDIGDFVLGEFVYSGKPADGDEFKDDGFERVDPRLPVTFDINALVSRRTAVFARAGYGKSNLVKLLASRLYGDEKNPPRTARGNPVGTLIFDADGEYFWSDEIAGRPGLCDMPHMRGRIKVFTSRVPAFARYKEQLAGGVRLDLRSLRAADVFSIALSPERQEQQNVLKLKAAKGDKWRKLVDLVKDEGMSAEHDEIGKLLGYREEQIKSAGAEIGAAHSNLNYVVNQLHDPESKLAENALACLSRGEVVVVDLSLLSPSGGEAVAGLLMRKIFSHNQESFVGDGRALTVVAVIEEAQRVLGEKMNETSPFVEWVKEGRKYGLGAVLVTQQPGALSGQLLSQVDNWFCFHLLSRGDAAVLGKYNSHYSDDILAHMIAEPIEGNCFMWSAPNKQPFVLPVRVREFRLPEGVRLDSAKFEGEIKSEETAAGRLEKAHDSNMRKMADALRAAICENHNNNGLGLTTFSGGWRGIKHGKLYYLIKGVKLDDEFRHEDDLKRPLFERIFESVKLENKDGVEYYCAPASEWEKILGGAGGKQSNRRR